MQNRMPGRSNLEVSAIGYGAMGLSLGYGTTTGKGVLPGKIDETTPLIEIDRRHTVHRFSAANRTSCQDVADLVRHFAKLKQAMPAQVAWAWWLARKPWTVVIPGTTKLGRLEANLGNAGVVLTELELQEIDRATARLQIVGDR